MTTTLSHGLTTAQKYGQYGIADSIEYPASSRPALAIRAVQGRGKSRFWQSWPGALVLNLNLSPLVHRPVVAQVLPLIGENRIPVEPDGKGGRRPLDLSWAWCLSIQSRLIDDARNNRPRPETIVIDDACTAYQLIQAHMLDVFNKNRDTERHPLPKTDFGDLGFGAWPAARFHLVDFIATLKKYGYGVGVTIPLADKIITEKSERPGDMGTKAVLPDHPRIQEELQALICDQMDDVGTIELATRSTLGKPSREVRVLSFVGQTEIPIRGKHVMCKIGKARTGMPSEIELSDQPALDYMRASEAAVLASTLKPPAATPAPSPASPPAAPPMTGESSPSPLKTPTMKPRKLPGLSIKPTGTPTAPAAN